jgi:hypothetical protein
MINEVRVIAFSHEALLEAARLYGTKGADGHRFSRVLGVEIEPGSPPVLAVTADIAGTAQRLVLSAAETAASLILLCRREKIPLPHRSQKTLSLDGGELCLVITREPYRLHTSDAS